MKINKTEARKEVEEWISSLGIRPHRLEKLKEHKAELINMISHGIARIEEGSIVYVLETPFDDGTKELKVKNKRYTVKEVSDMSAESEGDSTEKALAIFGMICNPPQPVNYMTSLKSDFHDINSIAAFFLPA